jgi:hypothetical protein
LYVGLLIYTQMNVWWTCVCLSPKPRGRFWRLLLLRHDIRRCLLEPVSWFKSMLRNCGVSPQWKPQACLYRRTSRTFSLCDAKFTLEVTGREQCLISGLQQYCMVIFFKFMLMYVCTASAARYTERLPIVLWTVCVFAVAILRATVRFRSMKSNHLIQWTYYRVSHSVPNLAFL